MIGIKGLIGINTRYYIIAFLLFSVVPAFYVWHSVWYSFFIVLVSGLFLIEIFNTGYDQKALLPTVLFIITYFIYSIRAGLNIFGAIEIFCLIPFFFARKDTLLQVYEAFLKVYAVLMAIGIPFYVLAVWLDVTLPNIEINPLNEAKLLRYFAFPFCVTQEGVFTQLNPRFYGVFDEPGVVGTISAILLVAERFNLKKWENIIILVSGVLSASLFFFLISGIYVLIEAPIKAKIVVIIIAIIAVVAFYDNELLYNIFFHRFNVDEGGLEGMNREHGDFNAFYERFRQTSDYWTGLGAGAGEKANEGGSSYKQLIVNYGMIFFLLYLLCFYIYAAGKFRGIKKFIMFSLILLGTMYQRPFVGTPALTFLMIASISVISVNYSNKQQIQDGRKISFNNGTNL